MTVLNAFAGRRGALCFGLAATLTCLAATLVLAGHQQLPLLETANKLGPSADSLVHGHGLAVCYGGDETCLYAQRMPVAPFTLAGLYLLFHEQRLAAALLKTLLCFLPVAFAFALIWRSAREGSARTRWASLCVFLLALLLPPTLDLAVNLNFEEAYFYGLFTLAVALLLFPRSLPRPWPWAALSWLTLALCYLTKSSMLPAVLFLAVAASFYLTRGTRRPGIAAIFLVAFACVPLLWGVRQQLASGRFTVGTSLDGVNLYKGNNPFFLNDYPAFLGASLDHEEATLFADHVSHTDEWAANDYGLASARRFIHDHPAATLQADLRKVSVFFLGVRRNGGDEVYNPLIENAFTAGLVIFRTILLAAVGLALQRLWSGGSERYAALVFLGSVVCVAAPYISGFALTRHAMILVFPSAAYLCRVLCDLPASQPRAKLRASGSAAFRRDVAGQAQ